VYTLVDAKARDNELEGKFNTPTWQEIKDLSVGEWVKLIFETDDERFEAERMWVKVTNIGFVFEGILDNEPAILTHMKPGDPITFTGKHIIDIHKGLTQ